MKVILRMLAALLLLSFGTACESGPPPFTGPRTFRRIGEAPRQNGVFLHLADEIAHWRFDELEHLDRDH